MPGNFDLGSLGFKFEFQIDPSAASNAGKAQGILDNLTKYGLQATASQIAVGEAAKDTSNKLGILSAKDRESNDKFYGKIILGFKDDIIKRRQIITDYQRGWQKINQDQFSSLSKFSVLNNPYAKLMDLGPLTKMDKLKDIFKNLFSGFSLTAKTETEKATGIFTNFFAKFKNKSFQKTAIDAANAGTTNILNNLIRNIPGIGGGLASGLSNLGGAAGIGGGLAIGAGVIAGVVSLGLATKKATDDSREFQDAWAKVNTVLEMGHKSTAGLRDQVIKLSADLGISAKDVAEGFYLAVSSGITNANDALKVTQVAAMAAAAGFTHTTVAVDGLTTVINAYQLQAKEAERVSDMFFIAVLEGKATFEELARSVGIALPFFAQANIKLEDFFSAVTTLSQGGLRTNIIMTALRGVIAQIIKPADSALKISKALGIEFTTQAIATKGLVGWLKELAEKTQLNTDTIAAMFPDVRGLTAVLALVNKQSETNARVNAEMATRVGITREAFEKQRDTLNKQWQLLSSKLNPVWIALGDLFTYNLKNAVTNLNRHFMSLNDQAIRAEGTFRDQQILLKTLIPTYEDLSNKTNRTEQENNDLKLTVESISKILPEAISKWDQYGNALEVNTNRAKQLATGLMEFSKNQLEGMQLSTSVKLQDISRQTEEAQKQLQQAADKLKDLVHPPIGSQTLISPAMITDAQNAFDKIADKLSKLSENKKNLEDMAQAIKNILNPTINVDDSASRNAVNQAKTTIQEIDEYFTREDEKKTAKQLDTFNAFLKSKNQAEIKNVAELETALQGERFSGLKKAWNEFISQQKKDAKKTAKELQQEQELILKNFLKNAAIGKDFENLSASQVTRLIEVLKKQYPDLFDKITEAAKSFDTQVSDDMAAKLKPVIGKFLQDKIIPTEDDMKKLEKQMNASRKYFENILSENIDVDIFKALWENWDTGFGKVLGKTKEEFVDTILKAWTEGAEKVQKNKLLFKLKYGISADDFYGIGADDAQVKSTPASRLSYFTSSGFLNNLIGKSLFGGNNKLNEELDITTKIFDKLKGLLTQINPELGEFLDSFKQKMQSILNNDKLNLTPGQTIGQSLGFAAQNLALNLGASFVTTFATRLAHLFGGGKSLLDVVNEQIAMKQAINALKEDLKTKSQSTISEAKKIAALVLSQNIKNDEWNRPGYDALTKIGQARIISEFERLGITIDDSMKGDNEEARRKLLEWLQNFIKTASDAQGSFGTLDTKTLPGIVENFQTLMDIIDPKDVQAKWALFIDLLKNSTDASARTLGTLFESIKDPDKIKNAASLIRQFIAAGGLGSLDKVNKDIISQLENILGMPIQQLVDLFKSSGLTSDQIDKLLQTIQGLGGDLAQGVKDNLDRVSVSRNVSITEQQGWTIIGVLNSLYSVTQEMQSALVSLYELIKKGYIDTGNGGGQIAGVGGMTVNIAMLNVYANSQYEGQQAAIGFRDQLHTSEQRIRSMGIKTVGQRTRR